MLSSTPPLTVTMPPPADKLAPPPPRDSRHREVPTRPPCPVEVALGVLGGKWRAVVLAELKQGPMQHGELRRALPRVSQKELTRCLRALQDDGLVERAELPGKVRRVRYSLTPEGRSLSGVLQALYDFGLDWADAHELEVRRASGRPA
jgi:DNA-binding HxlR family transcriptional regulator